jgi:hypothetical protein
VNTILPSSPTLLTHSHPCAGGVVRELRTEAPKQLGTADGIPNERSLDRATASL